jgi:hypothetical protein
MRADGELGGEGHLHGSRSACVDLGRGYLSRIEGDLLGSRVARVTFAGRGWLANCEGDSIHVVFST